MLPQRFVLIEIASRPNVLERPSFYDDDVSFYDDNGGGKLR